MEFFIWYFIGNIHVLWNVLIFIISTFTIISMLLFIYWNQITLQFLCENKRKPCQKQAVASPSPFPRFATSETWYVYVEKENEWPMRFANTPSWVYNSRKLIDIDRYLHECNGYNIQFQFIIFQDHKKLKRCLNMDPWCFPYTF